jgi:hypothetical protein
MTKKILEENINIKMRETHITKFNYIAQTTHLISTLKKHVISALNTRRTGRESKTRAHEFG